ncbi:hypothetical protein, partial [Mesorhizobium sp. M7A.F.Ca.CA.003.01.2.1]
LQARGAFNVAAAGRQQNQLIAVRAAALRNLEDGCRPGRIQKLETGVNDDGNVPAHGSIRPIYVISDET